MREDKFVLRWAKRLRAINMLGGKCIECGQTDYLLLDFHHRNPDEKEFGLCQITAHMAWEAIEKEALKCDLLCRECHALFHSEDLRKRILVCWDKIQSKMQDVHEVTKPALDKEQIYQLLKSKKTVSQVASIIGKGIGSVSEVARKLEVEKGEKLFLSRDEWNAKTRKIDASEAFRMREIGVRIVDIAAHFDASVSNMYNVLRRFKKNQLQKKDYDVNKMSDIVQWT
jgi:Mor family transcriptional regulator